MSNNLPIVISSQMAFELPPAPKPDPNIAHFIDHLDAERGWITASKLLVKAGWSVTESNQRLLREYASQSNGLNISGQRGYCHIKHATLEQIEHAAAWLQHQAVEMDKRARAIRRKMHKLHPQTK